MIDRPVAEKLHEVTADDQEVLKTPMNWSHSRFTLCSRANTHFGGGVTGVDGYHTKPDLE